MRSFALRDRLVSNLCDEIGEGRRVIAVRLFASGVRPVGQPVLRSGQVGVLHVPSESLRPERVAHQDRKAAQPFHPSANPTNKIPTSFQLIASCLS